MATKYDVVEYMHSRAVPLKPHEVAEAFRKSSAGYHVVYSLLLNLKSMGLLAQTSHGFQAIKNARSERLYNMIKFCLKNSISYNALLSKELAHFASASLLKRRVTAKDYNTDKRTFYKYAGILQDAGLLVVISSKPLAFTIPYNSFLRDLLAHFGEKVLVAKPRHNEYLSELGRELVRFRRLRKQDEARYIRILAEYQARFIHHSLGLEGNPMTLPDTVLLLKEHIVPTEYTLESIEEVQNYKNALMQMSAEERRPLTIESVLTYHLLSMRHRPLIAGRIRSLPVRIKGNPDYKTSKPAEIRSRLGSLLVIYNAFIKKKNTLKTILDFAAYFHNEFQHIHPFEDGNSRTTRLLVFHLLRSQGLPVLDIPLGLLESYLSSTKGATKRDDVQLQHVLQQVMLYNLRAVNERMVRKH